MKNDKKIITYSIIGILVMILGVVGVTYAWFSTNISGNGAEFNVTTATVGPLTYSGTEVTAENVMPGWISDDATLTVSGTVTGSEAVNYYCSIENIGEVTDVEYRISSDGEENSTNATWTSIDVNPIVTGSISSTNISDEYKLAIRFKETGLNQNEQQGKELSVKVTCNLDVTYQVNVTSTDNTLGTVSMTNNEILHGGSAIVNLNPANGYKYSSDTCNGVYKEKTLTINNVTTPTECEVTFEKVCEDGTLCNQILVVNPNVSVRNTFDTLFTESNNGDTIYEEVFTQDNEKYTTYYFAGSVTNNFVKFGTWKEDYSEIRGYISENPSNSYQYITYTSLEECNNATNFNYNCEEVEIAKSGDDMYWRIVRVNEDGSVRLLYAGTSPDSTTGYIGGTFYNTQSTASYYVGYKYTEGEQHGLNTDSKVKSFIDNWYLNNLVSNDNYISRTAIYCNDREVESGYTWESNPNNRLWYAAGDRLHLEKAKYTPTYECTNTLDRFTASASIGNNALEYPVGLITADEVAYAGGNYNPTQGNYYINENSPSPYIYWWTMSPSYWNDNYVYGLNVNHLTYSGSLWSATIGHNFDVRPVISLKSCVTWSKGDGTASSPYEVTVDSTCSALEN